MTLRTVLFSLGLALVSLTAAGCGQPCDADHTCDLDGDGKICDGHDFVTCADANRGKRIECGRTPRAAVCSPSGWAYDNTGH